MTLIGAILERLTRDDGFSAATKGRIGTGGELGGVPAVRITIVSDPRPQHFGGPQRVRQTGAQIDVWALTGEKASEIAEAAIQILTPPATVNAIQFQRGTVTNVRASREQEKGENVKRALVELHRASIDISFWHNA